MSESPDPATASPSTAGGPEPVDGSHAAGDRPRSSAESPQRRLAAGVRRLTDLMIGRTLPDDELNRAADGVAALVARLEEVAAPGKAPRGQPDHRGHPQDLFPTGPIAGLGNPLAPPVRIWTVTGKTGERELRGRVRFGYAYEGPPTCVHGGVLAATFDDVLGAANIVTGRAGMTGTLTVRYRRPTPLLADLDIVARQTGQEGRKLFCWAGIYHRGELTAEADGIFVRVLPDQMLKMVSANASEVGEQVVDTQLAEFLDHGGEILGGVDGPPPR